MTINGDLSREQRSVAALHACTLAINGDLDHQLTQLALGQSTRRVEQPHPHHPGERVHGGGLEDALWNLGGLTPRKRVSVCDGCLGARRRSGSQ